MAWRALDFTEGQALGRFVMADGLILCFIEIQFSAHLVCSLKTYHSVAGSMFTELCNHHQSTLERFHHSKRKPHAPSPSPWHPLICFLSPWICPFWTFYVRGIMKHVAFCVRLLSLSTSFQDSSTL